MKKRYFYYALTVLVGFFSFSSLTFASSCTYTVVDSDKDITATCDWDNCSSVWGCSCTLHIDGKDNSESTGNASNWYKENNKCLPYLVFLDRHALAGYELNYATSESDAQSKAQHLLAVNGTGSETFILRSDDLGNTAKTEEQTVLGYIENLKDFGNFFSLNDYCDLSDDGVYLAVTTGPHAYDTQLCRRAKSAAITKIQEWDVYVVNATSANKLTNSTINNYQQYRNVARLGLGYCTDCGDQSNPNDDPSINIGDIVDTGNNNIVELNYNTAKRTCVTCGNVTGIPAQIPTFISNIIIALQAIVPSLIIIMGMYDFIRAAMASDEKAMKESQGRFIRRLIAGIAIFMVIAIVKFAINLVPTGNDVLGCIPCFANNKCSTTYNCTAYNWDLNYEGTGSGNTFTGSYDNTSSNSSSNSSSSSNTSNSLKGCTQYSGDECPSRAENGDSCKVYYDSWDTSRTNGYCGVSGNTSLKGCTQYSGSDCPSKAENGDSCKVNYDNWDTTKSHGYCVASSTSSSSSSTSSECKCSSGCTCGGNGVAQTECSKSCTSNLNTCKNECATMTGGNSSGMSDCVKNRCSQYVLK